MRSGFTRGLLIGGIIGASVSMMTGNNMVKPRTRKRMMKSGRSFMRKSGDIIGDVVELFR
jgi:gas vesicle protein